MMEHYNRASASKKSARIEEVIENAILITPESQRLQKEILQNFQGKIFLY